MYHVLPYDGGLFDQPPSVLARLKAINQADHAIAEKARLKAESEARVKNK